MLPVTAMFGESWREIRQMLSARYDIEFVVSSHDPKLRTMSYDTGIAEILVVSKRLQEGEVPTGRGVFVNLWRTAYQETDSLALVRAVTSTASAPVHRSDGPPIGGTALLLGGELWGEMLNGPVGEGPWTTARWKQAQTGQFAAALKRGELWDMNGAHVVGRIPVAAMADVCNVGPQHRRIRGSLGVFDAYHGWNEQAQFPALWRHKESIHRTMSAEPNAWLIPKPGQNHLPIWSQCGTLHITPDVQYDSQRLVATRTSMLALGVRAWHTLIVRDKDSLVRSRREVALAVWCNSSLGLLLHADHANRAQVGRGTGSKGMLETLMTLDVRELDVWQLEEAQAIWREFRHQELQSFHQCAVDPVRIELDERVVRDMLGLNEDSVVAIARIRALLAGDPSIHGSKKPELPA